MSTVALAVSALLTTALLAITTSATAQPMTFRDPDGCALPLSLPQVLAMSKDSAVQSSSTSLVQQLEKGDRSAFVDGMLNTIYQGIPIGASGSASYKENKLKSASSFLHSTNTPTLYPTGRGHRASENPVEARHLVSGIMLGY